MPFVLLGCEMRELFRNIKKQSDSNSGISHLTSNWL